MSTWNHRILVSETDTDYPLFEIHEVFYNDEGILDGYTESPVHVSAENVEGIEWVLEKMKEALKKPVLYKGKIFPKEYANNSKSQI